MSSRKTTAKRRPVRSKQNWFTALFTDTSSRTRGTVLKKKNIYLGLIVCGVGILSALWYQEYPQRLAIDIYNKGLEATAKFGFRIKDIQIQGRQFTSAQKILEAIQLQVNDPIFKVSPDEIAANLKEISWIREVHVYRQLPNILFIKIEERVPIAIWQHQKNHYLVDNEGVIITNENIGQFNALPVTVGGDAPLHVPKILKILADFPDVLQKITALVRVGGRRWDIQINRKVTVKLPEVKPEEALKKLDDLIKQKKLNLDEISNIDLRLPNKMIMGLSPQGEVRLKGKGSEA